MSHALSVAKEFVKLSLSGEEKDPLTNLRLQKLLYYAQAWSLIVRDSELFPDDLQAWRYGPVVPAVYSRLPYDQGAVPLSAEVFADVPDLPPDEAVFVAHVWDAYNPYSATQLSRMTHDEMPWKRAWGNRPRDGSGNDPIALDDMERYFGCQAMPAAIATYSHDQRQREEEAERRLAAMPPLDIDRLRAATTSPTLTARPLVER